MSYSKIMMFKSLLIGNSFSFVFLNQFLNQFIYFGIIQTSKSWFQRMPIINRYKAIIIKSIFITSKPILKRPSPPYSP